MAANTNSVVGTNYKTQPVDSNGYVCSVLGGLKPTAGVTPCSANTTAYQLTSTSTPCKAVMISPSPVGSGAIYVGTSAAGLQASPVVGMFIAPNTPPQIFTVTDVSLLYVRSVNNSDNVGWIYFN